MYFPHFSSAPRAKAFDAVRTKRNVPGSEDFKKLTVSKKMLVNIVATMSDRASTEIKFNELVQDFRRQILPDLIENWSNILKRLPRKG
jgi:hypothetical protein